MWILIVIIFLIVAFCSNLTFWIGTSVGKQVGEQKRIIKGVTETGVLYGDSFIEKENELKSEFEEIANMREKIESDTDKAYRIHHGVSYKKFL